MMRVNKKFLFIFFFFLFIVLIVYWDLFSSYFIADEWFHFTQYLPLTNKPDGLLTALLSPFTNTSALSGGQHVNPIATLIFFFNVSFFGMNYVPYAFNSLFLHAGNSFLLFCLITLYLQKSTKAFIFAFLGSIFFAFAPTPMHTITGAAPFYGENILSVTFVLLCLITVKLAYLKKDKKYFYFSLLFLTGALFSKETSAYLLLLLPVVIFIEKRIFPLSFLGKLYIACIIFYVFLRFFLPNITVITSHQTTQQTEVFDNATIASNDISIHKNVPAEILFRTITFPIRTMGTVFAPRKTVETITGLLTPVMVPIHPGGDITGQMAFLYGSGNYVVIYVIGISLFIFCLVTIKRAFKNKKTEEARLLTLGLTIVVFSALPLVAIIFSFPRWGYDYYFDSRHYYHPTIGAAIIFPFLFWAIVHFVSKLLRVKSVKFIGVILFILWFLYNFQLLSANIKQFVDKYSSDRREFVTQLKQLMPTLPQKIVFYFETDGKGIYGPNLPFQTGVPQALTVVYYDASPLPDSFFTTPVLDGKPVGYQFSDGRGFGYYPTKRSLADALVAQKFSLDDVYAYYYEAEKVKLHDTTISLRKEMQSYLSEREMIADWKKFEASPSATETITFLYPPDTTIIENPIASTEARIVKDITINNPQFTAELKVVRITPTFDMHEGIALFSDRNTEEVTKPKQLVFDSYHFNDGVVTSVSGTINYLLKFNELLIITKTTPTADNTLEKILGSITVEKLQ